MPCAPELARKELSFAAINLTLDILSERFALESRNLSSNFPYESRSGILTKLIRETIENLGKSQKSLNRIGCASF